MKVTIKAQRLRTDPSLTIYHVEVEQSQPDRRGVWPETFGSPRDLEMFLRGLQVAYVISTDGYFNIPVIPEADSVVTSVGRLPGEVETDPDPDPYDEHDGFAGADDREDDERRARELRRAREPWT